MTYALVFVVAWLLAVVAYASWHAKPQIQVFVEDPRRLDPVLYTLALGALEVFCEMIRPHRPKTIMGTMKPFPTLEGRGCPIYEHIPNETYSKFGLSAQEIMSGDPEERVKAMATHLANDFIEKRVGCVPRGFMKPAVPGGLDYAIVLHDKTTGVWMRFLRAYDIRMNEMAVNIGVEVGL